MSATKHPSRRDVLALAGSAGGMGILGAACASSPPKAGCRRLFETMLLTGGEDRAAVAKQAGFAGMVTSVGTHLLPDRDEEEFAARLEKIASAPLPVRACNVFLSGSLRATGPRADHDAIERHAAKVFHRAGRAGVDRIVFGSASARALPEGFAQERAKDQFVALLRRLGPLAAAEGVRVVPENLNRGECNFLTRVEELVPIVAAVDHPAIRMTADLYHMAREEEDPEHLAAAIPWLAHLEIAEKAKRTVPGTAGDDFRPYFRVLCRHGWSGWLNVEAAGSDLAGYRRMFAFLDNQIEEASVMS